MSGVSYEHRKQWIVDRLKGLASVFAIDVCAYAVMSNHYHVVLKVRPAEAQGWDAELVVARWRQLFRGSLLVDRYIAGACGTQLEREAAEAMIDEWRARLFDISWFMRVLNEGIAREANREDGCKGRFWEGRFKSQALLDERALLACMAYVDLNPVRAGLADSPEESDFTSVQERLRAFGETASAGRTASDSGHSRGDAGPTSRHAEMPGAADTLLVAQSPAGNADWLGTSAPLAAFTGTSGDLNEAGLPFHLADYLLLVDWTGRQWREGKRGAMSSALPPLLDRLQVDVSTWIETVRRFQRGFHDYVGPVEALQRRSETLGRRWLRGVGACRVLWGTGNGTRTRAGVDPRP